MGIINEIKDGVKKNQVALDYLKENIVKVDGSPDDPKCFVDVSEFIGMHRQMLEKMDRLGKELGSLHRNMNVALEGLDSIYRHIKEEENKQRSFFDYLQEGLKAFREEIRNEFKDLSKHFERDN